MASFKWPSANSVSVKIFEDQTDTIDVIELAYDPDQSGLTLHAVGGASHGKTEKVGNRVVYIPNANYFGSDQLSFTVSDGEGDKATATVSVTILPTNDLPIAANMELLMLEDHVDSVNVLVPTPLTAATRKMYSLPLLRSVTGLPEIAGVGGSGVHVAPSSLEY